MARVFQQVQQARSYWRGLKNERMAAWLRFNQVGRLGRWDAIHGSLRCASTAPLLRSKQ